MINPKSEILNSKQIRISKFQIRNILEFRALELRDYLGFGA